MKKTKHSKTLYEMTSRNLIKICYGCIAVVETKDNVYIIMAVQDIS